MWWRGYRFWSRSDPSQSDPENQQLQGLEPLRGEERDLHLPVSLDLAAGQHESERLIIFIGDPQGRIPEVP